MKSIAGYSEHQCSNCGCIITISPDVEFGGLCDDCRQDKLDREELERESVERQDTEQHIDF